MSEDIIEYIIEKNSKKQKDVLWAKGDKFKLFDKAGNAFEVEAYGSYVDSNPNYKRVPLPAKKLYGSAREKFEDFDGQRKKDYFLLDSNALEAMIKEMQNNSNCSFTSSVDELVKDGYVPEKFSVLLMDGHKSGKRDEFGSWLLNFFEVPVVFNKLLTNKFRDGWSGAECNGAILASVDFLKLGQRFITISDYLEDYVGVNVDRTQNFRLESFLEDFKSVYDEHYKRVAKSSPKDCPSEEERERKFKSWESQLCYEKLCRAYGLGDWDYCIYNAGVIIEGNKISIAPNLDLEYSGGYHQFIPNEYKRLIEFYMIGENKAEDEVGLYNLIKTNLVGTSDANRKACFFKDIIYIANNHPEVIDKFISKVDEITARDENGQSVLDSYLNDYYYFFNAPFEKHLKTVKSYCEIIREHEKQDVSDIEMGSN